MKPPLIEALGLKVRNAARYEYLAGMILLGLELRHIQRNEGYQGEGSWWRCRGEKRPKWESRCIDLAGVTEATARNLYQCAMAVMTRLEYRGCAASKRTLRMMEKQPSTLTDSGRDKLIRSIIKLGLSLGDTQSYLRKEYRARLVPKKPAAKLPKPAGTTGLIASEPASDEGKLSIAELYERFPDEVDRNHYLLGVSSGMTQQKAGMFVCVMREMKRRHAAGIRTF